MADESGDAMPAPGHGHLADRRRRAGYTQESFAERLGVDRTTVGRWERGVQAPQPWQRPDIAAALSLTLEAVADLLRDTGTHTRTANIDGEVGGQAHLTARRPEEYGQDSIDASMTRLRRALDCQDLPADGPTRSLDRLAAVVDRMIERRLDARYLEMAWVLPDLLAELSRSAQLSPADSRRADRLLALAYRAADGVAYKYGYLDLSARIIDRMRSAASRTEDPLLVAAVAYVRTEVFFATGDLDTAAIALTRAADDVSRYGTVGVPAVAAYGALHMRAAVVAGRAGKADTAWDHMAEARRAADRVPDDVYTGTAFGPSSVRVHDIAVAVELRENGAAVERAGSWVPSRRLPAERRSHYYIELAGAQLDIGRHEDSYRSLEHARRIAPQHAREHPHVRRSLSRLLRSHPSPSSGMLTLAAWARAH